MEAPEKIFIQSFNVSEEDAKFDKSKLFFDDVWTEEPEPRLENPRTENIEYTRTDAFIEKACEWLKNSSYGYLTENWGEIELDRETLAVDFANYMKGE